MCQNIEKLSYLLGSQKIIPVLIIEKIKHAIPLANTLAKAGLKTIEITLRTDNACEAIRIIAQECKDVQVGAGTVLNPKDFLKAYEAGAKFIVSPGFHKNLAKISTETKIPLLPGAVTPSEILTALDHGYNHLKFFPAHYIGGLPYLKALASPFKTVKFCPTGGITAKDAKNWLDLPNVFCLGGSWIAPKILIQDENFSEIERLAKEAACL